MKSTEIAKRLKMQHFSIMRLVKTYEKMFLSLGKLKIKKTNPSKLGGRPQLYIEELNEKQQFFLIILMKNTNEVVKKKFEIIKKIN